MPDLNNPTTYAEWYWKNSVDAVGLRAEQIEQALSPIATSINATYEGLQGIPADISQMFSLLSKPPDPTWDEILVGYVGSALSKVTDILFNGKMREMDYALNDMLQNKLITPDVANIMKMRQKISDEFWERRQTTAGFNLAEGTFLYESQKPYPTIPDIMRISRYLGDVTNIKPYVQDLFDVSEKDFIMWDFLSRQQLNTEQVMSLLKYGFWDEITANTELAKLGWYDYSASAVRQLAYEVPNAMLLVQGGLLENLSDEYIKGLIQRGGIHPNFIGEYLDGILTKPASSDIIAYELRRDPTLSNLPNELRRIGIHPNYYGLYRELAYQIPPVQDIITMAVREAFTPAIAQRFGQYEDLPTPFVEYAQKKGLSKDWAERYWAAHWSLPSATQGFEMLHRGVIGQDDLHLLLRAQDVMPFWRDKLIQIAYRPLSRVDVRRMYALGVLDEKGVKKAYTDLGYNDANANLMTQFTIDYTRGKPKRITSSEIVTAYKNWLISTGTASNLLRDIGQTQNNINLILRDAEHKRNWKLKQEQTDAVENLYKKGKLSDADVIGQLTQLGYDGMYAQTLRQKWTARAAVEKESLWTTAQTLSFLKSGIITQERARQEFVNLGYDTEHIDIYLRSVTPKEEV